MKIILENLDFTKIRVMEKYREKWQLNKTEISLDELPMGNFIEIEGEKKSIKKVVEILGLNFKNRITQTYWDLWKEYTKGKGIKFIPDELILESEKQKLVCLLKYPKN